MDFQPMLEELLKEAGCDKSDARDLAERELRSLNGTLIQLEFAHPRDHSDIFKVRLPLSNEAELYRLIDRPAPTEMRARWSALFREAETWPAPEAYAVEWSNFCARRAADAVHWQNMGEFRRNELEAGRELLQLIAKLMAWPQREQFLRAVSCRICDDSKRLERQRGVLESLLDEATGGRLTGFAALGILDTPRHVLVVGPLRLLFADHVLDLRHLRDGSSLAEADIERAEIECLAPRCVTVENKTSFHQRAIRQTNDLHIHTSYPGAATLALLKKLPRTMEFFHFGDTDPAGFDILRDLRESTGLAVRSLGMDCAPCDDSPLLTPEETTLLERLASHPLMVEERAMLLTMLASKRKGAFEQEHR